MRKYILFENNIIEEKEYDLLKHLPVNLIFLKGWNIGIFNF